VTLTRSAACEVVSQMPTDHRHAPDDLALHASAGEGRESVATPAVSRSLPRRQSAAWTAD
jgi:hypothetical protein